MPGNRPSSSRSSRPGTRPAGRRVSGRAGGAASRSPRPEAPPRPRFTGRAVVLVLVLAVLAVSYASSLRAYLEQKAHLESLRASIAESERNIAEMRREKRRWEDPAYLEAQASRRLGWVKPGEVAFQVIGRDGEPLDHDDTLTDPGEIEVENEPAWWEKAWATMEAAGHPEDVPRPAEEIDPPRPEEKNERP